MQMYPNASKLSPVTSKNLRETSEYSNSRRCGYFHMSNRRAKALPSYRAAPLFHWGCETADCHNDRNSVQAYFKEGDNSGVPGASHTIPVQTPLEKSLGRFWAERQPRRPLVPNLFRTHLEPVVNPSRTGSSKKMFGDAINLEY